MQLTGSEPRVRRRPRPHDAASTFRIGSEANIETWPPHVRHAGRRIASQRSMAERPGVSGDGEGRPAYAVRDLRQISAGKCRALLVE